MTQERPQSISFSQAEHEILHFWNEAKIFQRTLKEREEAERFTFYDGPPFATGLPHYGHLLAGTIKDVVCRFMSMKGYYVPRRFGWDCHGLPIESLVEKRQGLSGAASIREFGIARFNEACRENVLQYTQQWRHVVTRLGRWVDMDHSYRTMDLTFMESVWWVFTELFKKGLVYKGYKVMPFSWKLGTPLSNFEAGENYQSVDDPSLVVAFADTSDPKLSYLAWTTTPWTLISNMALVVGPEIEYLRVRWQEQSWIVAKERVAEVFKDKAYEVEATLFGKELIGRSYQPLFTPFAHLKAEGAFRVVGASFVSTGDGTGIVHAAPAFGEEDFEVCKQNGVPMVCPINENGVFTEGPYEGQLWKECQRGIIRDLKERGCLFSQATHHHRYPFCYRTDTPLIYRATETWFIAVEKLKEQLVAHNRQIHWVPEHIRDGRFGKWLEGAKDWAISRSRFWGTPIPLWQADDGELIAVSSRRELEQLCGEAVEDLHRHLIDSLQIKQDGKVFRRIDAVFDCWFESGAMPYAQNHYPFEHREITEASLPADFIAEGLDQTRGWFYTLHVLSCALFDRPAFHNVIVNGIVLAEDGSKMSKRLENYPDPLKLLERYGADALRLYLLKSPVVRAEDLAFSESGVDAVLKQLLLPWWNAFHFWRTYAQLYGWTAAQAPELEREALSELDRWVLSRLQTLLHTVDEAMSCYHLWEAVDALVAFIEEMTNWYIRRSRRRFWSEQQPSDRDAAIHTLYHVLLTLSKVAAPFAPFLSERIYQQLKGVASPESVHLCNWPQPLASRRDPQLEKVMAAIQKLSSLGHSLRKEHKLRVRQPLRQAWIVDASGTLGPCLMQQMALLADEINVKAIGLKAQASDLLRPCYKPNFKSLGPRAGKRMGQLQARIQSLSDQEFQQLKEQGHLKVLLEEQPFELMKHDVLLEHQLLPGQVAAYEEGLAIALETELDEALLLEGMARELVNKINTLRKEKGFEISDRIHLRLASSPVQPLVSLLATYRAYICEETLCSQIDLDPALDRIDLTVELSSHQVHLAIIRLPLQGTKL